MAEELAGPSFYSYNLTVESRISVDELIYTLSPTDLPLRMGVGLDGGSILPRQPVNTTIFYWLEEEVPLPRGALAASVADTTTTSITVATGHAVRFAVGDGIRIDDEIMIVTAINTATEVLTVTRGSASGTNSTAATHANGAEVIGLGTILIEGAVGVANFQGRDRYSNYCQIFSKKITSSRTARRIPKYGVPDELVRQTMHATQSLNLGIEQTALYGIPHLVTATNRRQTGGLDHFITTNENTTDDWITVAGIEAMQQDIYDAGGNGRLILMANPAAFQALNNTMDTGRVTQQDIGDGRRGRSRATVVTTGFGDVQLVRNRWVKDTEAFLYNPQGFVERVFQPLVVQPLAKTDDTDSFMMVAELGYEVKGQGHMGKWTSLDTAAALPAGLV